ncbi:MAG: chitobiase/beta-hexosaminidase C-terminal domain-containing protein, partial [Acidobacteriota bacterium]
TVATVNGDLVLSQWAQTNDLADDGVDQDSIDDVPESTLGVQVPGGRTYTRSSYEDAGGGVVMEKILVDGMGHNWSGGVLGGTFTDPDGPDASRLLADFFLGAGPAVDTTPPTTTASPSGGTFGSSVTVTLTADEPATTYFTLDGTTPDTASSVYAAPLQISVDTTLRFFSIDVAGNAESVRSAVFVIGGGGDTTPPTTTASPPGGSYGGPVSVTLSADEAATTYYTLDGSVPTTGSPVYGAPLAVTSDAVLSFFSVDAAGNVEGIRSETYTFPATSTVALPSIGAEDGYVGQLWADGFSTGVHRAGDKGFFNTDTYRLILSFDASGLPAGATVTGATLTIHRASLTGTVSQLTADVVADGFGAGPALVRGDYSAPADLVGAFTVSVPAADGASTSTPLPAAALPFVTGDRFQVRLRATAPIGFASDVLTLFGGESSSPPVLEVTYE